MNDFEEIKARIEEIKVENKADRDRLQRAVQAAAQEVEDIRNALQQKAVTLMVEQTEIIKQSLISSKTLRDEFEMAALPLFFNSGVAGEHYWREAIAKLTYQMADAMLEARKAKGE